ncbi:hypothetical protein HMPREF1141_0679 [Clostridium sp. MSTE9]|nr:hypothetical protein HMPREF1141_0679 [Clostridium sp. MSTE9]
MGRSDQEFLNTLLSRRMLLRREFLRRFFPHFNSPSSKVPHTYKRSAYFSRFDTSIIFLYDLL